MITFIRTATIAPGKAHEAMTFAHKVAKMVEAKVGAKDRVSVPVGGMLGRIAWVAPFDNMAAFESAATKLMTDADYMKLVESSEPYFVPGSVHDEVWTSVPPEAGLA